MAQLKKMENTMSDHPELQKLLDSVDLDLDNLFDEDNSNDNTKEKNTHSSK